MFDESGTKFSEIGLMFKDTQTMDNINERIEVASKRFSEIADIEEEAYAYLKKNV
jgi:hypothetical protein